MTKMDVMLKSEFTAVMMALALTGCLLGYIFRDNLIYAFIIAGIIIALTIILPAEPIKEG